MKINLPKDVEFIINKLEDYGFEGYIVGGSVRDSILNRPIHDWDITTNALPEQIKEIFMEQHGVQVIPTGLKHGTLSLIINNIGYEVTTFRCDGDYSDGRHPNEVRFVKNIVEDLSRRDITINAIAYNYKKGIVDPFQGMQDIKNKIIRCVGNPYDRFNEDGLRILRVIRFMSQLNFEIDEYTFEAIGKCNSNLNNISKERIRDELCKTLLGDNVKDALLASTLQCLFDYFIPQLEKCVYFKQHNKHHDKDVFLHTLHVIQNCPKKLDIRLAALFHDIGKPECFSMDENGEGHFYKHHIYSADIAKQIMQDLRFDNKTIEKVYILVKEHMSRYDKLKTSNIKKFINRVGIDNLEDLFELQIADAKSSAPGYQDFSGVLKLREQCNKIINEKQPLTRKDLAIDGRNLIELGFKPGKNLGEIINNLLDKVLEDPSINKKEILINLAKDMK